MKKILSTHDLKPGTVLRVYKKGFGYAILRVIEAHELYLAAFAPDDFISRAVPGDRLKAYLWIEESGTYEFPLVVNGSISRQHAILFCGHTDRIKRGDAPKCLTARLSAPLRFFVLDANSSKGFTTKRIVVHTGALVELSDRSALLRYDGDLSDGTLIKGHLRSGSHTVDILGRVTRSATRGARRYRIDISAMNERERNAVLDYVFSVYRE
ncbi:MAG TPA: hypothetical protein PKM65_12280 [Spirochaetota bacterium]|nr:hypothetical protein [Spirochaetota bacterium]HNT09577.1 hypothetical protein [Spirochaetota bacterium]HNV45621.1 hypothetical protein [Spirochaetota bacterium]HOS38946.1 hypothetical protein [Spirochaetota bacterium]HPI22547.1 hypothetical protein [Spirochaetota bacterium]